MAKNIKITKKDLSEVNTTLKRLHKCFPSQEGDKNNAVPPQTLPTDESDVSGVFNGLLKMVNFMANQLCDMKNVTDTEMIEKSRIHCDEIDEVKQRGMKGNLVVSSISYVKDAKPCLIKTDEQLKTEKKTLTEHAQELVLSKFGVKLPVEDIQALHRLQTKRKNGQSENQAFLLKINNRRPGAAWHDIINGIKQGKKVEQNVYFNFQLTRKRSKLLHHVRGLKKANKIKKFYQDENGKIQIFVKEGEKGIPITYNTLNLSSGEMPKTMTVSELDIIANE